MAERTCRWEWVFGHNGWAIEGWLAGCAGFMTEDYRKTLSPRFCPRCGGRVELEIKKSQKDENNA